MAPIRTSIANERLERIAELNARYGKAATLDALDAVLHREFPGKTAVVSSFGTESAILLNLVAQVDPATPVIFLDTLKHFGETQAYRKTLQETLGLTDVRDVRPDPDGLRAEDPDGTLHKIDPDRCCYVRKTLPMIRALRGFSCWITGRKRFQGDARASLSLFEAEDRWVKVNPLYKWSKDDIDAAFEVSGLPRHPLMEMGYLSVGCGPCSSPVAPGETDPRAGRWRGQDKTECGIHFVDGKVVRGSISDDVKSRD